MIEFSIKDYVSLLTLNFVFKENSFCLADYKGNVPLFPSTDETYINPLLRKYLIREKKTFELSDNTYIPDINNSLFEIVKTPKEHNFSDKEIRDLQNEISFFECLNYMKICLSDFRKNPSVSSDTAHLIKESLNVLSIQQVVHIILAAKNSSMHLLKHNYFDPVIACSQCIKLFKGNLIKAVKGEMIAKEERSIPVGFVHSVYSYIFFLCFIVNLSYQSK